MKYLSKLMSMLLIGGMLYSTGCTDYASDIEDLNQKVDDLEKELVEGQINPLKADLAKAKEDLEAALKAAEERLATAHKEDIDALKQVDSNLDAKIGEANAAILELEGALATEVEALEAEIQKLQGEIDALESALEAAKKEAKDDNDALKNELLTKITDLETQLQAKIAELQTKLEGEIADLREEMQEKIDAANDAIDEANKAIDALDLRADNLEAADEALQNEIDQTQADLATTNAELTKAKEELAAADAKLAEDLANAKAELEKAIADGDAKLQAALEEAVKNLEASIAEEKAAREEAVAKLEAAIEALNNKLEEELNLLKHRDAEFEAQLAAAKTGIEALGKKVDAYYAEVKADVAALDAKLSADIAANQAAIAQNKVNIDRALASIDTLNSQVAALQVSLNAMNTTLANHLAAYANFQAEVNGRLASLEAAQAALEATIVDLKENVIPAIEQQILINEELINQNVADIKANADALEEFKNASANTFDLLRQADEDLWTAISTINGYVFENKAELAAIRDELAKTKTAIEDEIAAAFATLKSDINTINDTLVNYYVLAVEEFGAVRAEIAANKLAIEAEVKAREEADKAISDALATLKAQYEAKVKELDDKITALDVRLATLERALEEYKEQVKIMIEEAVNRAVKESNDYTDKKANELQAMIQTNTDAIKALDAKLDQAIKDVTAAYEAADKAIREEVKLAVENLQELINGILNRVQSIVFVPEYADGKGTINWAKAGDTLVESRSTLVYQVYPAYCAAAIANTPAVGDVVAPLAFDMTDALKTRGGLDKAPQMNIVGVEGDAQGRLYVTFEARNFGEKFYAGEVEYAASLVLTTENENLASCYTNLVAAKSDKAEQISMDIMYGDEVITKCYNPTENGEAYQFEYTDTERVEKVLPEHYVRFTVAGKTYDGIDALNGAGYALELNRTNYIKRVFSDQTDTRPFKVEEVDGILQVSVEEVNGKLIYQPIYVGYTYTAGTLKAEAYSNFSTVPVQADIEFSGIETFWLYSTDAAVDAAGNGAYNRTLDLTIAESTLPSDVKALDVLAKTPKSIKVTLDGKEATEVGAKIVVSGEKMFLEFANFEWDKTYEVEAEYDVADQYGQVSVEVTVKATVTTVDRNRETIIVNLEPSTAMFEPNLVMTKLYGDIMEPAFTQLVFGNEKHYDIPAKKWCEANFSLGQYTALDALKADGKDVDAKNTKLLIDETTGWEVSVAFDYEDFDFVPAQVEYTKTITTWYGQEVIVNKVLNFEFPVYDFKHNSKYVYGADMDFYSQVQPEYTWYNDNEAAGLLKFDVAAVELRAAFSVVDAKGNKLSEAEMDNLSLSYNFEIEDAEHEGIDIDPATDRLSYYGSNPFVNVRGNLVITNSNGAKYVVPTSFDEGGKYASYNVVKFNPIGTAQVTMNPTIDVNNSIAYNVDILDYVKLEDYRTGGRQSYPLITDGAWVIGNGENGFAQGVDVRADHMYRINEVWVNDTSDVDDEIRPYITLNNGTLTFDNSQQLELTAPFTIPVTLKFQNCWMEKPQQVTVNVTFNPIK